MLGELASDTAGPGALMGAEVIDALLKYGTSPGVVLLFLLWQEQRRKRNGNGITAEKLEQVVDDAVTKALASQREQAAQHLDLALTKNFMWVLKDLGHKVTEEHEKSRKDWTNSLQRFMFDLELFVLRGQPPTRSPRE